MKLPVEAVTILVGVLAVDILVAGWVAVEWVVVEVVTVAAADVAVGVNRTHFRNRKRCPLSSVLQKRVRIEWV